MEPRAADAFVRERVADLVLSRTLIVAVAAAQAVSGCRIAIREPGAVQAVRPAVLEVEAHAERAALADRAGGGAIPAVVRIPCGVHTAWCTCLEARCADAIVDVRIAYLIATGALLGLGASGQALTAALVAVGESNAARAVGATVTGIGTDPRIADVPTGA